MKALLLSAGYGKRMRPLTLTTPKCLIKIKNKTLLGLWLDKLKKLNINDCLVNTHHLSKKINKFLEENYDKKVKTVYERKLLGTAGTLIKNYKFFKNEDCIMIHSDNYCEDDLKKLIKSFIKRPKYCLMTMMVFKTESPKSSGVVDLNSKKILKKMFEKVKNPPGNIANCAIYIISKQMIKILKKNYSKSKDFSNEIIPNFYGKINTYQTKKTFYDIGSKRMKLS
tara:strand:- start:218 stop:892 length:675 start_codon:yes stop_codon:yes gene_type:complete